VNIRVQKGISYTIKLSPLTLPLSPANGGEGGGGKDKKAISYTIKLILENG
jgi:hypothetical protein